MLMLFIEVKYHFYNAIKRFGIKMQNMTKLCKFLIKNPFIAFSLTIKH